MLGALAVAGGGAAGSLLRYGAVLLSERIWPGAFPWGTVAVNVLGSFVIGWFASVSAGQELRLLVMTGVCGGFTTFSAFSLQTVVLLRAGDFTAAGLNVLLSVMLCLAATFAGHWVAMRTV
jgi:CrcB protein